MGSSSKQNIFKGLKHLLILIGIFLLLWFALKEAYKIGWETPLDPDYWDDDKHNNPTAPLGRETEMKSETDISKDAYLLWLRNGKPTDKEVLFWTEATKGFSFLSVNVHEFNVTDPIDESSQPPS